MHLKCCLTALSLPTAARSRTSIVGVFNEESYQPLEQSPSLQMRSDHKADATIASCKHSRARSAHSQHWTSHANCNKLRLLSMIDQHYGLSSTNDLSNKSLPRRSFFFR